MEVMNEPRPRHTYLGGPDLAAIAGASRYQGPYDVYLRKTGQAETPDNAPMEWGRRLEGAVAQAYSDKTGHTLEQPSTIFHPEFGFIGGTPDYLVTDDAGILLECKTSAEEQLRMVDDKGDPLWGPTGTDEVPLDYYVQCQAYMGLTGRRRCDLAVFFLGARREFRIYTLEFDRELFGLVLEKGVSFWRDHVEARVPPPMDLIPSDLVTSHLARRALDAGSSVDIPADLLPVAMELEAVGRSRGELDGREDQLKARILKEMAALGAQKLQGKMGGAKFSLAIQGGGDGKPVTDWRGIAFQLAKMAGLPGIPHEMEIDYTKPGKPKSPYLMPYFTAVRNAAKKDAPETQQQLSA